MAKKKRVTRKQLLKEPDEFLTFSAKALRLTMEYKTRVIWAIGTLFGVVIIIVAINYSLSAAENRAFEMLDRNMAKYTSLSEADGPVKAATDVEDDFQMLLEKYRGRKGGQFARLMYADICFKAGQLDRSIELYQEALKDFAAMQPYKNLILNSLGIAYEEKQDHANAVQYLERITGATEGLMKGEALFSLGRIYAAMGQKEKSIAAYNQLIEEYPGTRNIGIAQDKVTH
jgi:tetratricopeptide (TPR) repeat protein